MILPHLSASARVNAASSSGLDVAVSTAMVSIRFFTSGKNRIRPISALSRATISLRHAGGSVGGVPDGHLEAGKGLGHGRNVRQER